MRRAALQQQTIPSRLISQRRFKSTAQSDNLEVKFSKNIRVPRTLPHRDFKVSTYANTIPLDKVPVDCTRLEQHYYNTLVEDLMLLTYDHESPNADLNAASLNTTKELPGHYLRTLFSTPLEDLSTEPVGTTGTCTNLITKKMITESKRPKRLFKKGNPIDFVGMKSEELNQNQDNGSIAPYTPVHEFLPALKKIELRIIDHGAIQNK
jgi:hypothetical protein